MVLVCEALELGVIWSDRHGRGAARGGEAKGGMRGGAAGACDGASRQGSVAWSQSLLAEHHTHNAVRSHAGRSNEVGDAELE